MEIKKMVRKDQASLVIIGSLREMCSCNCYSFQFNLFHSSLMPLLLLLSFKNLWITQNCSCQIVTTNQIIHGRKWTELLFQNEDATTTDSLFMLSLVQRLFGCEIHEERLQIVCILRLVVLEKIACSSHWTCTSSVLSTGERII